MSVSDATRDACLSCIGRERSVVDSMAPEPVADLAKLLGMQVPDGLLTTWHWVYFNTVIAPEDVGHDGHERLGLFLPPVPFKRRMWAGGTVDVLQPLSVGIPATKVSRIADVAFKTGKSGEMCFVTVAHEVSQQGLAIRETQTLVYRDRGDPEPALRGADDPVPAGFQTVPDTTLLAYSALTQNGHRIHWDRDFCRDVEGYPGLVVHGPLLATHLANALVPEPGTCRFTYRATAPVYETSPFRVTRSDGSATIERSDGVTAMRAELEHAASP